MGPTSYMIVLDSSPAALSILKKSARHGHDGSTISSRAARRPVSIATIRSSTVPRTSAVTLASPRSRGTSSGVATVGNAVDGSSPQDAADSATARATGNHKMRRRDTGRTLRLTRHAYPPLCWVTAQKRRYETCCRPGANRRACERDSLADVSLHGRKARLRRPTRLPDSGTSATVAR